MLYSFHTVLQLWIFQVETSFFHTNRWLWPNWKWSVSKSMNAPLCLTKGWFFFNEVFICALVPSVLWRQASIFNEKQVPRDLPTQRSHRLDLMITDVITFHLYAWDRRVLPNSALLQLCYVTYLTFVNCLTHTLNSIITREYRLLYIFNLSLN